MPNQGQFRILLISLLFPMLLLFGCGLDDSAKADGDRESAPPDGDEDALSDAEETPSESAETEEEPGESPESEGEWELPYASPEGLGAYRVGGRRATFASDRQADRELPGVIWYPTEDESGEPFRRMGVLSDPDVFADATMAARGPFPVLVFSHGNSGFSEQSSYFTEFMAGHGFVVAACEHLGNTVKDYDESIMGYTAQQRPQDISIVIDALEGMNADPQDPLYRKLDFTRLSVAGHSFGGSTSLYIAGATLTPGVFDAYCHPMGEETGGTACALFTDEHIAQFDYDLDRYDPRVKAIIPQTPAMAALFGAQGLSGVAVPVLLMGAGKDKTLPWDDDSLMTFEALSGDIFFLTLKDAGHFTYSDMCDLSPEYGDGCGEGYIPPARARALINTYSLAFLRVMVLGDERDRSYLGSEYASDQPEVDFRVKSP